MGSEQIISSLKANPIGVACGALSLALAIGIYVRSDRLPEAEKTLEQKATLADRLAANLQNGIQLSEHYTAITTARQQIDARLVHPDELANNLRFFYKLEDETGIKLIDIRQTSVNGNRAVARTKGNYITVSYGVAVRGSYARLLDFLRRLESNQRFCRVYSASINVGSGSQAERAGDLTLSLAIELLAQP